MKYLSLFSGIGGFELGIQQSYESLYNAVGDKTEGDSNTSSDMSDHPSDVLQERRQRPVCIGYSEIDKYAIKVYERNFTKHVCDRAEQTEQRARTAAGRSSLYSESRGIGNEESNCNCERPKNYGDITKIKEEELPDFDLIVGGFPCQSFSIAGKRGGFNDTRGTLFFDIARIIRAKQPRLLLLENVKGLLSHDEGRTFATIISALDELGYDVQWQVLNSKNHGVPQNRERVFIIGHLRGTPRPEVFPFGETDRATDQGLEQENTEIASTLRSRYGNGSGSHIKIPEATKKGYAEALPGQSINLSVIGSKTRRGRVSDMAQTLDTGMQQYTLTEEMMIRRLTPTECERLQGFPDGWTKEGSEIIVGEDGKLKWKDMFISDTQRYKCLGNAVTVSVIKDIMEKML